MKGAGIVCKANSLIESSYRLSLYEQRIILGCIAMVQRDAPLTDQHLYVLSARELAESSGADLSSTYNSMKIAAERLFERRVTISRDPKGNEIVNRKRRYMVTRWVQSIDYHESEGTIALRFSKDIIPYLSQLEEQFTLYALSDVAKMTSTHAIRLYELLAQWRKKGRLKIEIEKLREAFQLEGRYPSTADLRRWVIDPAVEQINERSPMHVEWQPLKTGRRISHLEFNFDMRDDKPRIQQPQPPESQNGLFGVSHAEIIAGSLPGESYDDAALRLARLKRATA